MGRRGAVALTFAVATVPIAMATATAVDFSRIAAGRAALQRAADNAALSGAAAYVVYSKGDTFNAVAVTMATSAFCNATTALPGGFAVRASTGSKPCGAAQGPVVSAVIAGYKTGTPGTAVNSGCDATHTVVTGYKCGFVVTVTATATTTTAFAGLLGASTTLLVTAMAVNPFINLANALTPILAGTAWNANSIWVYPLLLNANGQPDFVTNSGALQDTSLCTGDPTQTSCGEYSMVASTKYATCKDANPCTTAGPCTTSTTSIACPGPANSAIFAGSGGVIRNIEASSAVITATTPLGVAFQSATGGYQSTPPETPSIAYNQFGWNSAVVPSASRWQRNDCAWPATTAYNTVPQAYDASNISLLPWTLVTHWFYSSYLANNLPPSQRLIDVQSTSQVIPSMPRVVNSQNQSTNCTGLISSNPTETFSTKYPTSGTTNCSLYIVKDPADLDLSSANAKADNKGCYNPTSTTNLISVTTKKYADLSCQNYGKSRYAFFWNDMGGGDFGRYPPNADDTDYYNGTLFVNCAAISNVILIN